jgi:hypothetical protein
MGQEAARWEAAPMLLRQEEIVYRAIPDAAAYQVSAAEPVGFSKTPPTCGN